jgi:hypothetical protein
MVNDQFITVEGPKKKEVVDFTMEGTETTYVSQLQNPEYAKFVVNSTTNTVGVIVIDDRDVTITSTADVRGVLTVYGF